jgi:hypothetical protein
MVNPFLPAANKRLVNFDMAAQRPFMVAVRHEFAEFMAYTPCGFVSDSYLALDFLRGDAMARTGH